MYIPKPSSSTWCKFHPNFSISVWHSIQKFQNSKLNFSAIRKNNPKPLKLRKVPWRKITLSNAQLLGVPESRVIRATSWILNSTEGVVVLFLNIFFVRSTLVMESLLMQFHAFDNTERCTWPIEYPIPSWFRLFFRSFEYNVGELFFSLPHKDSVSDPYKKPLPASANQPDAPTIVRRKEIATHPFAPETEQKLNDLSMFDKLHVCWNPCVSMAKALRPPPVGSIPVVPRPGPLLSMTLD